VSLSSPYPDVEIPDISVYDYLFGGIEEAESDRVALVDVTTGAQFCAAVRARLSEVLECLRSAMWR
jgi:hypothetical protein